MSYSDNNWYYSSSSDQGYYYHNNDNNINEDAFLSINNDDGLSYADPTTELQSSQDLLNLDIEKAKRGEKKLGLKLTKTPSLLSLFSSAAASSQAEENAVSSDKLKAANFPILSLIIGNWMRESRYEGQLVAKCYFKKRQLVWEILNGNLKNKIEFQWSNISAIKAIFQDNNPGVLDIMLEKPPLFFHEVNPQPRKHTNWEQCEDFTDNQASLVRKHRLIFGLGVLEKHYNKIIQADSKLHYISQQPFPYQASIYFNEIHFSNQHSFHHAPTALPPQIPLNPNLPVLDFSGHTTSVNYPLHEDPLLHNAHQEIEFVHPNVSASGIMENDTGGLPSLDNYVIPQEYLEQVDALRTGFPDMEQSYNYNQGVANFHQLSNEYQNLQYYYNARRNQWL